MNDHTHIIKLTAYTTTSQIMIQPKKEKPEAHSHLGNKYTPRFFGETFLMPWAEVIQKENISA